MPYILGLQTVCSFIFKTASICLVNIEAVDVDIITPFCRELIVSM